MLAFAMTKLTARTTDEAHLYMDTRACECGSTEFGRKQALVRQGEKLVSVYVGNCGKCGKERRFEFVLPDEFVPPSARVKFGGDEPSTILGPGEFFAESVRRAKDAPLVATDPQERIRATAIMHFSVAALEEVLKFIPADAQAVPESAFTSELGRQAYAEEPGRFKRDRLEVVLAGYWEVLNSYGETVH